MTFVFLLLAALPIEAQIIGAYRGGAPPPRNNPHTSQQSPRPIRYRSGTFGGYYNTHSSEVIILPATNPPPPDKLHELIVSPIYQKEKITPKLIEIP